MTRPIPALLSFARVLPSAATMLAATSFLFAPVASADDFESIEEGGTYAGLSVAIGGLLDDDLDPSVGGGLGAKVGHRFGRWLAAELEGEWVQHAIYDAPGDSDVDFLTVTANARVNYARVGNGELWASGGVGITSVVSNADFSRGADNGFAARFATGVDVYITETLGFTMNGSYVLPTGDLDDFDYIVGRVGLFHRF